MHRAVMVLCAAIAFTTSNVNTLAAAEDSNQMLESLLAAAHDAQSRRDFNAAAESYRKAVGSRTMGQSRADVSRVWKTG